MGSTPYGQPPSPQPMSEALQLVANGGARLSQGSPGMLGLSPYSGGSPYAPRQSPSQPSWNQASPAGSQGGPGQQQSPALYTGQWAPQAPSLEPQERASPGYQRNGSGRQLPPLQPAHPSLPEIRYDAQGQVQGQRQGQCPHAGGELGAYLPSPTGSARGVHMGGRQAGDDAGGFVQGSQSLMFPQAVLHDSRQPDPS